MTHRSLVFFSVLTLMPASTYAQTPVAPEYTIIDLGGLGGPTGASTVTSLGKSINNAGQVVGEARTAANETRATLFSGTGSNNVNLGTLSGSSSANAINDSGQIVGESRNANNNLRATLFSTMPGALPNDLGTLGGTSSSAYDINNGGQIVGYARTSTNAQIATLFQAGGSNVSLGTLAGGTQSFANSISDTGVIVGSSNATGTGFNPHATIFNGTGNTDLGVLTGTSSGANVVNNVGQIVGGATSVEGYNRAAQFVGSGNIDLGTLGGNTASVVGLNDIGQMVGTSNPAGETGKAYLLTGGSMNRLLDLSATSAAALGVTEIRFDGGANKINNWGQIAATAYFSNPGNPGGEGYRAILLNPVNPITSLSDSGATRNTKFVAGMNYAKFTSLASSDGKVSVSFLDGTAGSNGPGGFGLNRDVNVTFLTPSMTTTEGVFGESMELHGTQGDTFVLALNYQEAALVALFGSEEGATLGWWDGSAWVRAVNGNSEGGGQFIDGAWNDSYALGTYGVDRENNLVWAVIDHNSGEYAIISVPEPSSVLLAGFSTLALCLRRRRAA